MTMSQYNFQFAVAAVNGVVAVVVLDVDDVSVSVVVATVSKDEVNLHDAFAVVAAHTL